MVASERHKHRSSKVAWDRLRPIGLDKHGTFGRGYRGHNLGDEHVAFDSACACGALGGFYYTRAAKYRRIWIEDSDLYDMLIEENEAALRRRKGPA